MNPNQYPGMPSQPPVDRSIDYLNQIAPQSRLKRGPSNLVLLGAAGAAVLAIILFFAIIFGSQPSTSARLTSLYARLQTLQSVASTEQRNLKDNTLRTTNSSLSLLLTNSLRDIGSKLQNGSQSVQLPASVTASEKSYLAKLTGEFTDAKLNVELDSTYAREMAYQLSLVHTMMKSLYASADTTSLKTLLSTTNDNLTPIQQAFSSFSGSKE